MNLTLHFEAPTRVLVSEDESFKSCQENRTQVVDGGIPDTERFKQIMADDSYTITPYKETAEGIANTLETKKFDERMWRNERIDQISYQINDIEDRGKDASTLRAFRIILRDYPQQPDFPNSKRPEL